MLARNFLVLEYESGRLANPEIDAAENMGPEEYFSHVIAESSVKAST
jgi:hypothetical protein